MVDLRAWQPEVVLFWYSVLNGFFHGDCGMEQIIPRLTYFINRNLSPELRQSYRLVNIWLIKKLITLPKSCLSIALDRKLDFRYCGLEAWNPFQLRFRENKPLKKGSQTTFCFCCWKYKKRLKSTHPGCDTLMCSLQWGQ